MLSRPEPVDSDVGSSIVRSVGRSWLQQFASERRKRWFHLNIIEHLTHSGVVVKKILGERMAWRVFSILFPTFKLSLRPPTLHKIHIIYSDKIWIIQDTKIPLNRTVKSTDETTLLQKYVYNND